MDFFPEFILRTRDRSEPILPFWRPATSKAFGVNPRLLPEGISGAVDKSRIYREARMEFIEFAIYWLRLERGGRSRLRRLRDEMRGPPLIVPVVLAIS
jgi:hypothetical protein